MSAEFRGRDRGPATEGGSNGRGGGNKTRNFNEQQPDEDYPHLDDTPLEASAEVPPALKLGIGVAELVFGFSSNVVQVVTTAMAIIALIVGGSASTLTTLNFDEITHKFGWYTIIGLVIAGAIQLFLHKNAQPMSGTWQRLRHIQDFNIRSTHALRDVKNAVSINTVYFLLSLGADIISDATFVNLFTHNPLVVLFWVVFLTGSSTLLFYDGATRVWGAFEDYKDYKAYHQTYN